MKPSRISNVELLVSYLLVSYLLVSYLLVSYMLVICLLVSYMLVRRLDCISKLLVSRACFN